MIADLKPYPEYRETGSRWLGKVPAHWGVHNLRTLIKSRNERNQAELPLLSVAREKGVFVRSMTGDDRNHNVIPDDLTNYKVARAGNLVINKMKAWQGSMGIAPCDGVVSPAYYVFDFRISNRAFGQLLLRSKPYVAHFGQASDGVRVGQWDLSIPGMRQIPIVVPPPDEQAAIVRFLNHTNQRIERTIRAKRKIIALLNEQKQVIIHRAVTRGLDPNVRLKPSGVPWVDGVPEHWTMTPNRSLFRIRKVLVGSRHKEYQVLSLTKQGVIVRNMDAGGKFSSHWERSQEVRPGDIVFCFFDVDETPRAIGLSPAFGMISPDYTVMECRNPLIASFLECFYVAMDDRKMLRPLYTGLRKRISKPLFLAAKSPIPPTEELRTILAFVKDAVVEIDRSLDSITREIDLLREYRTRLIADVVTGKLDVREAAALLPDEVEEIEEVMLDDDDVTGEEVEA
jgi:type I restriction enzyme S subunit